MSTKIIKAHIGKRVLLTDWCTNVSADEVLILEVSPSGKRAKVQSVDRDNSYWVETDEDVIKEILAPLPKERTLK